MVEPPFLRRPSANAVEMGQVVAEVGSGLNRTRPKLARVLSDPSASVIVVEHRDRLARFGLEHLQAVLAAQGRRIVVVVMVKPLMIWCAT